MAPLYSIHLRDLYAVEVHEEAAPDFRIYPNPSREAVNVHWSTAGVRNIQVVDALGKIVWREPNSLVNRNGLQVNVQEWADGLYTILGSGGDQTLVTRFVKQ